MPQYFRHFQKYAEGSSMKHVLHIFWCDELMLAIYNDEKGAQYRGWY
jgi:hypothetical protein